MVYNNRKHKMNYSALRIPTFTRSHSCRVGANLCAIHHCQSVFAFPMAKNSPRMLQRIPSIPTFRLVVPKRAAMRLEWFWLIFTKRPWNRTKSMKNERKSPTSTSTIGKKYYKDIYQSLLSFKLIRCGAHEFNGIDSYFVFNFFF
jgi:hypothetical protein